MGQVYGYIRVSSTDQNEDRQLLAMQSRDVPKIVAYLPAREICLGDKSHGARDMQRRIAK